MIPYSVYKIVHLVGVFMILTSLSALTLHVGLGGGRVHSWRKLVAGTHGVGLLLALVGGFGLLARLGIGHGGLPGWVWAKLAIWATFGGIITVILRKAEWSKALWFTILFLGGLGAYLANYKPF